MQIYIFYIKLNNFEYDKLPDVLIFGAVKCLKEVKSRFWFTLKM